MPNDHSASQWKFDAPYGGHGAPVSLVGLRSAVTSRRRLPRLVKRLEVEDIHIPSTNAAHAHVEERLGVRRRRNSVAVIGTSYKSDEQLLAQPQTPLILCDLHKGF